jgi:endonuclease YncB( thermonuclease family)
MAGLVTGRDLRCEDRGRDRYGRTVAQCFAGRRDIAAEMVRQGRAEDWPRYSKGFYAR